MASATGAGIARGLERGLARFLDVQERERQQQRQEDRDERLEERHTARMARMERQRVSEEAGAARRGVTLPGVERTREAGPQATVDGEELTLEQGAAPGLELRDRGEGGGGGFFEGADLGGPGRDPSSGDARPELGPEPTSGGDATGMRQAFSEEIERAASAPPGAEPSVAPGALDPETGQFASGPVFGRSSQEGEGPRTRDFLERGEVERRGPEFRLSGGERFRPEEGERRALEEETARILQARPDLDRAEARLLAEGRSDALTYNRRLEGEMDRTFNVGGREYTDIDEARRARRTLGIGGAGRRGGEDRGTQKERLANQYGFNSVAEYERFEQRVESLQDIYGTVQGDPLLQRALENRARGLSESEVIQKVRQDAERAGYDQRQIQAAVRDVRGFFQQRSSRQLQELREGNIGGVGNLGSGFDLEFEAEGGGGEGRDRRSGGGGTGPLRDRR